jgi:hypothetical protein
MNIKASLCCTALLLCAVLAPARAETPVDIELVIAADVSISMDQDEKWLQQQGFVAAFRDPDVLDAIRSGPMGRIAVTYFEWGGESRHRIVIPWMVIDGRQAAERFAAQLERSRPARFKRGTSLASALLRSRQLFGQRSGSAARRVINISGDGTDNSEPKLAAARSEALAGDVTINGLPIVYKGLLEGIVTGATQSEVDPKLLMTYFEAQVIGGPFAFVEPVIARESYAQAIRRKLIREIRMPIFAGLRPD